MCGPHLVVLVQAPGVEDPVTVVTKHLEYPDAPNDVRHHPNQLRTYYIYNILFSYVVILKCKKKCNT